VFVGKNNVNILMVMRTTCIVLVEQGGVRTRKVDSKARMMSQKM
jgi:hypothetical protein